MDFPQFISFTVTNACNLRCQMCGQWSGEGYIRNRVRKSESVMQLADWKRLVDEAAHHPVRFILVRGGEPFLYPHIIELLEYILDKGIFLSLDTNGTLLKNFAADLVRIEKMHITFSVDGPEEIHDKVRGVRGSFQQTRENIALLHELEKSKEHKISKSICFTISPYSYKGLGEMPGVARRLGINSMNIVPYYFVSQKMGEKYEDELRENFRCSGFSWKGFHHEDSGIDFELFKGEYRKYLANLGGIYDFPYMPMTEEEYRIWFNDAFTPVRSSACMNVEKLIDIQPGGEANFCVDFPDYSFGNAKVSSIRELWNSAAAGQFRSYRRQRPLAACYRCGAKYISEIKE